MPAILDQATHGRFPFVLHGIQGKQEVRLLLEWLRLELTYSEWQQEVVLYFAIGHHIAQLFNAEA